jgi:hypothetical protein
MLLDWVMSIFVASIAAVAMVSTVTAVMDVDASSYSVSLAMQSVVDTITSHVNRVQGLSGNFTENFTFNGTGAVSLPSNAGATPFPYRTIAYTLAFTRDVVLAASNISAGYVSSWAAFSNPVYLVTWANFLKISGSPYLTYSQLQNMDEACLYITAGIPFTLALKEVWVDGQGEYLPLIYLPGYVYAWPSCP